MAAVREISWTWNGTLNCLKPSCLCYFIGTENRDRSQQALCIWVFWFGKDLINSRFLDNSSGIHYAYSIGNFGNDSKIMRDQQHCQFARLAKAVEQFENLCLDGDIQRSGRFVCDQQFGIAREGHCDHNSLT